MMAMPGAGSTPRPALPWARRTVGDMTPEVEALVDRAAVQIGQYEAQFPNFSADERYEERLFKYERTTVTDVRPPSGGQTQIVTQQEGAWALAAERLILSEYALVRAPGARIARGFRDAFEVDGKRVREPDKRLERAFLEPLAEATKLASAFAAQTATHSLGFVSQTISQPNFVVALLKAPTRTRFIFWKAGESVVGGVRAWEIAYSERTLPTLVQTDSGDAPVDGSVWIDPATGRVLRTTLGLALEGTMIEITVMWRPEPQGGAVWVPSEMREVYESRDRKLECVATYQNIRKLEVKEQ
jgi:hypothetical protein